jgi:hypothetical protein
MENQQETPKRKGLRLTKQQKAYQEAVLAEFNLQEQFKPATDLVRQLALEYSIERHQHKELREAFETYKKRSILFIAWEKIFKTK